MKPITSMSVNFVTDKNKRHGKIVYIMWNDWFTNRKKYKNNFSYANELMCFTNSAALSSLYHNFDKIMTYSIEDAIQLSYDSGFSYAVIQTPGHALLYQFKDSLENYINSLEHEWSIIGHILNFKKYNHWLTLHDQCFVLNLKHVEFVGNQLGYANDGPRLFPDYLVSDENFHDDYTPKTVQFNEKYFKTETYGLGWKWLSYGLLNNNIITFNNEVRNKKIHLYPENPGNQEAWYDINQADEDNQLKKIINEFAVKDPRQHVYNNENVFSGLKNIITDKIDHVVVAASGFYGMQAAKLLDAKTVYYYDQDELLLRFREKLNDNWSGVESLSNFYTDEMNVFHDQTLRHIGAVDGEIIMSMDELRNYLEIFKSLPKFYRQVDIIEDWQDFFNFIPKEGSIYIWLDSIYTYWYNIWNHRPSTIQKSFISLVYKLQERKDPTWINVKEPSGQYRIFEVHNYSPDSLQLFFSRYENFA